MGITAPAELTMKNRYTIMIRETDCKQRDMNIWCSRREISSYFGYSQRRLCVDTKHKHYYEKLYGLFSLELVWKTQEKSVHAL